MSEREGRRGGGAEERRGRGAGKRARDTYVNEVPWLKTFEAGNPTHETNAA